MAKRQMKTKEVAKTPQAKEVPKEVEAQPESDNLIRRVYLNTKTGLIILEGADAEADIQAIQKACRDCEDGDMPYTFYEEDNTPVYYANKDGYLSPLAFPEPGSDLTKEQMGVTSMQLYSWAVTLPDTIEKIIEKETKPKPSLIDQARKIMTPTLVIVASIVAIFLIAAMMKG